MKVNLDHGKLSRDQQQSLLTHWATFNSVSLPSLYVSSSLWKNTYLWSSYKKWTLLTILMIRWPNPEDRQFDTECVTHSLRWIQYRKMGEPFLGRSSWPQGLLSMKRTDLKAQFSCHSLSWCLSHAILYDLIHSPQLLSAASKAMLLKASFLVWYCELETCWSKNSKALL